MYWLYWCILLSSVFFLPILAINLAKRSNQLKQYFLVQSSFRNSWLLLLCIILICSFIFYGDMFNSGGGNFLLHFFGGGVVTSLIFTFTLSHIRYQIPLLLQLVLLYFLVSGLGCANELLEFLLDTITKNPYSMSRIDTWKDMLANTSGAVVGFISIVLVQTIRKKFFSQNKTLS
jgi:hypothetical protein